MKRKDLVVQIEIKKGKRKTVSMKTMTGEIYFLVNSNEPLNRMAWVSDLYTYKLIYCTKEEAERHKKEDIKINPSFSKFPYYWGDEEI